MIKFYVKKHVFIVAGCGSVEFVSIMYKAFIRLGLNIYFIDLI